MPILLKNISGVEGLSVCVACLVSLAFMAGGFGWASGFLKVPESRPSTANVTLGIIRSLIAPAFAEELLWRAILLPHPEATLAFARSG